MNDSQLFAAIFTAEGVIRLGWDVASQCVTLRPDGSPCLSEDTRQYYAGCATCGGYGTVFAARVEVRGLFRDQSRWTANRMSGERPLGEAQLTTPTTVKPGYRDRKIRDRFTVLDATGDTAVGRVFYPAASPIPFLFAGAQHGWRVQLQSLEQASRVEPQP